MNPLKIPSARALTRLPLGALCSYCDEVGGPVTGMVIGCWRYKEPTGPGARNHREQLVNVCPRQVDWADGYLVLPQMQGQQLIYAWFGDVSLGMLKAL